MATPLPEQNPAIPRQYSLSRALLHLGGGNIRYVIAKAAELHDHEITRVTAVSGHTLKCPLAAFVAVLVVGRQEANGLHELVVPRDIRSVQRFPLPGPSKTVYDALKRAAEVALAEGACDPKDDRGQIAA